MDEYEFRAIKPTDRMDPENFGVMGSVEPVDLDLSELSNKVRAMISWLDETFSANCSEADYCDGCVSCDGGMAIKHLKLIEKALKPFTP